MGPSRFEPVSGRCGCRIIVTGVILDDAKLQHSFADCEEERAALTATA